MKIGILTFHWASNHGAILQAYALQQYLCSINPEYDVQVIDYYPEKYDKSFKRIFKSLNPIAIKKNYNEYRKEKKIKDFRSKLNRTKRFYTTYELEKDIDLFDLVIVGSDQVWNEAFTLRGEGKITTIYYLPFVGKFRKISYAASFGYETMSTEIKEIVLPLLEKFDAISVREKSGQKLLKEVGVPSQVVCDPTLLLHKEEYQKICEGKCAEKFIAKYVLRKQTSETIQQIDKIIASSKDDKNVIDIEMTSIEKWLNLIKNASLLVTNSFHGVVFSLIFHTPFVVVLENSSRQGMNDRLLTLLSYVDLQDRIISNNTDMGLKDLKDIDWEYIDKSILSISEKSKDFLLYNCNLALDSFEECK